MATDTRFVVDQFALCNRFASLGVMKEDNSLLPQSYGRVQTPYLKQNRKESFDVAYGDTNKTYSFPESLQVLASAYVKVTLPLNGSGNYKQLPGAHIVDKVYIRCNGDLVYSVPYRTLLLDHIASLDDADARAYCAAHLGYRAGAASGLVPVGCTSPSPTRRSGGTVDADRVLSPSTPSETTRLRSASTSTRRNTLLRTGTTRRRPSRGGRSS